MSDDSGGWSVVSYRRRKATRHAMRGPGDRQNAIDHGEDSADRRQD
ncbi:hypothetical protein A2U01_0109734, partial [Trifolium medium]|nr:hypothetical protein [Trifolium medium]